MGPDFASSFTYKLALIAFGGVMKEKIEQDEIFKSLVTYYGVAD